jgi:hypothetical protein
MPTLVLDVPLEQGEISVLKITVGVKMVILITILIQIIVMPVIITFAELVLEMTQHVIFLAMTHVLLAILLETVLLVH